jgi:hypothetical protein
MDFVPIVDAVLRVATNVMGIRPPPLTTDQKIAAWNTIGVWIAGFATFLAVCAAIGVPAIQATMRRQERKRNEWHTALVMAIDMNVAMGGLLSQILDKRPFVDHAIAGNLNSNPIGFQLNAKLLGDFPPGGDLAILPYPLGPSIAALRASLTIYNGLVDRAVGLTDKKALNDSLKDLKIAQALNATQAALARAAGHLGKYEPAYKLVNYFDDGSGGNIQPLPDYV